MCTYAYVNFLRKINYAAPLSCAEMRRHSVSMNRQCRLKVGGYNEEKDKRFKLPFI